MCIHSRAMRQLHKNCCKLNVKFGIPILLNDMDNTSPMECHCRIRSNSADWTPLSAKKKNNSELGKIYTHS